MSLYSQESSSSTVAKPHPHHQARLAEEKAAKEAEEKRKREESRNRLKEKASLWS